jgi:N-acyl amino acid synthase of PEP-CTERM/exosortase system
LSDGDVSLAVLTALYQASKRMHATHWLMAIERSLERVVRRYGLPFRYVGPEADYFGPVAPCVIDLAELDAVILTGRFPALNQLSVDLPPPCDPLVGLPATIAAEGSR